MDNILTKTIFIPNNNSQTYVDGGIPTNEFIVQDMSLDQNKPIMDFLISICSQYHLLPFSEFGVWAPTGVNGSLELCKASCKLGSLLVDGNVDRQYPVPYLKIMSRRKSATNATASEVTKDSYAKNSNRQSADIIKSSENKIFGNCSKNSSLHSVFRDENVPYRYDSFSSNEFYESRLATSATLPTNNNKPPDFTRTYPGSGTMPTPQHTRSSQPCVKPYVTENLPFTVTQRLLITLLPLRTRKKYVIRVCPTQPLCTVLHSLYSEYPNLTKLNSENGGHSPNSICYYSLVGPVDRAATSSLNNISHESIVTGLDGVEYVTLNPLACLRDYPTLCKDSHVFLLLQDDVISYPPYDNTCIQNDGYPHTICKSETLPVRPPSKLDEPEDQIYGKTQVIDFKNRTLPIDPLKIPTNENIETLSLNDGSNGDVKVCINDHSKLVESTYNGLDNRVYNHTPKAKYHREDDIKSISSSGYHGSSNSPSPCNTQVIAASRSKKKVSAPKPPTLIPSFDDFKSNVYPIVESKNEPIPKISQQQLNSNEPLSTLNLSIIAKSTKDKHLEDITKPKNAYSVNANICVQSPSDMVQDEEYYLNERNGIEENIYENMEETMADGAIFVEENIGEIENYNLKETAIKNVPTTMHNLAQRIVKNKLEISSSSPTTDSIYSQILRKSPSEIKSENSFLEPKESPTPKTLPPISSPLQTLNRIKEVKNTCNPLAIAKSNVASSRSCPSYDVPVIKDEIREKPCKLVTNKNKANKSTLNTTCPGMIFRTSNDMSRCIGEKLRRSSDIMNPKASKSQISTINSVPETQNKRLPTLLDKSKERPWTINTFFKSSTPPSNKMTCNKPKQALTQHAISTDGILPENKAQLTNIKNSSLKSPEPSICSSLDNRPNNYKLTPNKTEYLDSRTPSPRVPLSCSTPLEAEEPYASPDPNNVQPIPDLFKADIDVNSETDEFIETSESRSPPFDKPPTPNLASICCNSFFSSPSFKSSLYSKFNNIQQSLATSSVSSRSSSPSSTSSFSEEREEGNGNRDNLDASIKARIISKPIVSPESPIHDVNNNVLLHDGDDNKNKLHLAYSPFPCFKRTSQMELEPTCRDLLMVQIRKCGGKGILKHTSTVKRETCTIFKSRVSSSP